MVGWALKYNYLPTYHVFFEGAQLAVAAAENYTEVNITVRVQKTTTCGDVILSTNDNAQLSFRLHAQEVVRVLCDGDITGSFVSSNKPVAVISGNMCVKVKHLKIILTSPSSLLPPPRPPSHTQTHTHRDTDTH